MDRKRFLYRGKAKSSEALFTLSKDIFFPIQEITLQAREKEPQKTRLSTKKFPWLKKPGVINQTSLDFCLNFWVCTWRAKKIFPNFLGHLMSWTAFGETFAEHSET